MEQVGSPTTAHAMTDAAMGRWPAASPILVACYARDDARLEALLAEQLPLDIFEAAAAGRAGRVSELLDRDTGLARAFGPEGLMPIHHAAYFGHTGVVRRLLRRGASAIATARNELRVQPIHSAAAGGQSGVIAQLLGHGALVNARDSSGLTALQIAEARGDTAMIDLLRTHGARRTDPADELAPDEGSDAGAEESQSMPQPAAVEPTGIARYHDGRLATR
jgi:uncharacterized protein